MKKVFTSLFFSISFLFGYAQWGQVNSVTFTPANPTVTDTVFLIANVTISSTGCPLVNTDITNPSAGTYLVRAYHCAGALAALCNATDTINLGVLPAGTNNVVYDLWAGEDFSLQCEDFFPADIDTIPVFVSSPTGISAHAVTSLQVVSIDDEWLLINEAEKINGNKDFALYSITGRMVFNKTLSEGENKINRTLSPGIYFYRLRTSNNFYYGKVFSD